MSSAEQVTMPLSERLIGQVKWFNKKAGYGFITIKDGEYADKDIFAHYSTLRVTTSQYKYLMEGEYVEFDLVKTEGGKHEYQATGISGIKGGGLMCETRNANRQANLHEYEANPETTQRRYRIKEETAGDRRPSRGPRSDGNRNDGNRRPDTRNKKNPTPSEQN